MANSQVYAISIVVTTGVIKLTDFSNIYIGMALLWSSKLIKHTNHLFVHASEETILFIMAMLATTILDISEVRSIVRRAPHASILWFLGYYLGHVAHIR